MISSQELQIENTLDPCDPEEADSRIMVHHCSQKGLKKLWMRSVDTDVLLCAKSKLFKLLNYGLYFVLKNYKLIPYHLFGNSWNK